MIDGDGNAIAKNSKVTTHQTIENLNQYLDENCYDSFYCNCEFIGCSFKNIDFETFIDCTFIKCTFNKNDPKFTKEITEAIIKKKVKFIECIFDSITLLEYFFKMCDNCLKIEDVINEVASRGNINSLKGVTLYAV